MSEGKQICWQNLRFASGGAIAAWGQRATFLHVSMLRSVEPAAGLEPATPCLQDACRPSGGSVNVLATFMPGLWLHG